MAAARAVEKVSGADVKIKNNSGKRAIDYAKENKDLKDSEALKQLTKLSK